MPTATLTTLRIALLGGCTIALLACTVTPGGGAVSGSLPGGVATESPAFGSPGAGDGSGGGTGGSGGDASGGSGGDSGVGGPSPSDDSGILQPGVPSLVVPSPGRLGPHPTGAMALEVKAVGGRVRARLTWWSGVAPCTVLDSVRIERADRRITLTIIEGADKLRVACIEIAMLKATDVDLGALDPGTWTIGAFGDAPPVTITVP